MEGHPAGAGAPTPGKPRPVFADRTGRRRRITVLAGTSMGVGLLASLSLVIAGLFGGSALPLPGWPESNVQQRQGDAELRPSPPPLPRHTMTPRPGTRPTPERTGPAPTPPPGPPTTATDRPTGPPADISTPGNGNGGGPPPGKGPSRSPGRPG